MKVKLLCIFILTLICLVTSGWGFYAHQRINRIAVFTLPMEMSGFYKEHIQYLTEKSVNPDKRRYILKNEAPRHYIDLDVYGDSAAYTLPMYWADAVAQFTEDTLMAYGIVPWQVNRVKFQLTQAFLNRDVQAILRFSADLGHYIADANVPLHTTENYNGQLTGQVGIHGFWESRLPELFFNEYDLFTGTAKYLDNPQLEAWKAVRQAHEALDSVLLFEKELSDKISQDKKYSYEERGSTTLRVYSFHFSEEYHAMLNGMVERQMSRAIRMVGSFWYTAWVDGGQPNLDQLIATPEQMEEQELLSIKSTPALRNHESGQVE